MDSIVTNVVSGRDASLSFSWLHQRVSSYSNPTRRASTRAEIWTLGTGTAMTVVGLMVVAASGWLPARFVQVVAVGCLALEISAFLAYFALTIRNGLPQFTRPRETHASEIDEAFAKWQALVIEIRRFPRPEREARFRFILALRKRMGDRMGLMYGSLQHLGIFPLLIAFYLQFRTWRWGDWSSAFNVNPVIALLIFAMVAMYFMGWLLVGLRSRVDMYASLLEESLQDGRVDRDGST